MKKFLRSLIHYPYAERRGIFLLTAFIAVFFFIECAKFFIEREKHSTLLHIAHIPIDTSRILQSQKKYTQNSYPSQFKSAKLLSAPTNPNELSEADWIHLGLSIKQAQSTIRFKNKIGGFKSIKDLENCYTIPKVVYNSNKNLFVFQKAAIHISDKTVVQIPINSSDSAAWTSLNGIGPTLAARIVKFRQRLGGFHSKEQLKDVYGISLELYNSIENNLILDQSKLLQVKLNYATYKEFALIPYLNKEEIKAIILYREKNGFFTNKNILLDQHLLNAEKYFKIEPYLVL